MMRVADAVFIDTNVLIYAAIPQTPFCLRARAALANVERSGQEPWVSRQVIREFLAYMSKTPHREYRPADILDAARTLEKHYQVAEEHSVVSEQLCLLLDKVVCGGKQVHDANIVATMLAYAQRCKRFYRTASTAAPLFSYPQMLCPVSAATTT